MHGGTQERGGELKSREHVVKDTKTRFGKRGPGQPEAFHSRGSIRRATPLHMLRYVL